MLLCVVLLVLLAVAAGTAIAIDRARDRQQRAAVERISALLNESAAAPQRLRCSSAELRQRRGHAARRDGTIPVVSPSASLKSIHHETATRRRTPRSAPSGQTGPVSAGKDTGPVTTSQAVA